MKAPSVHFANRDIELVCIGFRASFFMHNPSSASCCHFSLNTGDVPLLYSIEITLPIRKALGKAQKTIIHVFAAHF